MTLRKKLLAVAFVGTGISSPLRVFCEGSPSRTSDFLLGFRLVAITPHCIMHLRANTADIECC